MAVDLAAEFAALRRRAGLTQEQVAERCGLSVRTLRNLEAGRHVPRQTTVELIVEGLVLDDVSAARLRAVAAGGDVKATEVSAWRSTPHQLPADPRHFTGRERELRSLDDLTADRQAGLAPPLVVVSGTAGVGKTALVVRWARRRAGVYADGEVFIDLRGYSSEVPVEPTEALTRLLVRIGVEPPGGPLDDLIAAWRSALDGRQVLVVLDNAASAAQVRPLLPTSPMCCVVITSRNSLAGLVAQEGAARIDLDVLPPEDSTRLLRTVMRPPGRPDAHGLRRLAEACAHLPLALRIAGELAIARANVNVAELADRLGRDPLSGLDTPDDPQTALRAVFMMSYRALPTPARQAFRSLGVHPAPMFDRVTASHLLGVPPVSTTAQLDPLVRAHMVMAYGDDAFGMHDLLHAFARELSEADPAASAAALGRLVEHLLSAARTAVAVGDRPSRRWLADKQAVLVATAVRAARSGYSEATVAFADTLGSHLEAAAAYPDLVNLMRAAANAAQGLGREDRAAQAWRLLAVAHYRLGQPEPALAAGHRALQAFRAVADRRGEARCLMNIGSIQWRSGYGDDALSYYRLALDVYRADQDDTGAAGALCNIGIVLNEQGRIDAAIRYYTGAIVAYERCGDRRFQSVALTNLGEVYAKLGRFERACATLARAVAIARETDNRNDEGIALGNLGDVSLRQGRDREARRYFVMALRAARDVGDRVGEGLAVDSLGVIYRRRGDHHRAERAHRHALDLAQETRDRDGQCVATLHLAEVALDRNQAETAREHTINALGLAEDLGTPARLAQALNVLATLEERTGDRAGALATRRRALACARRAGDIPELSATLRGLAAHHDDSGRADLADRCRRYAIAVFSDPSDGKHRARRAQQAEPHR